MFSVIIHGKPDMLQSEEGLTRILESVSSHRLIGWRSRQYVHGGCSELNRPRCICGCCFSLSV